MKFITIALALFAGSTFVAAAPVQEESTTPNAEPIFHPQDCPNGWAFCGRCNGTKCKVAGFNFPCGYGTSCSKQSGGGDGALCGTDYNHFTGPYHCPGHH